MTIRARMLSLPSLILLIGLIAGPSVQAQEIWLAPQASIPPSPLARAADFMDMFKPDAPWKDAASHTRVFKLYGSFVNPASQEQINAVIADLKRRGIAIGLEVGVMNTLISATSSRRIWRSSRDGKATCRNGPAVFVPRWDGPWLSYTSIFPGVCRIKMARRPI